MLDEKKALLLRERRTIDECLFYIDEKQKFYDDVTAGKTPYVSNLLPLSLIHISEPTRP